MKFRCNILAVVVLFCSGSAYSQDKKNPVKGTQTTRQIMDSIMASMVAVIPTSFDLAKFSSPEIRKENLEKFKALSENAAQLVHHASLKDKSFAFLAESLGRDVRELYRRYDRGNYEEAQYLLQHTIENCVGCHSKLPEGAPAPNLSAFFKNVDSDRLSVLEKTLLQTALRQFDDALKTYEDYFAKTKKTSDLLRTDSIVEYMKIAIRVKGDPKRALVTLNDLSKRNDLPKFLALELNAWIQSLERIAKMGDVKSNQLGVAVKMIQEAQKKMEFPADRSGVADYIFASSLLNRFVNQPLRPKDQEAEAFYWLGVTESLIGRSFWVSQTENYLESSIRLAPKGKFAQKSYRMLEQYVIFQYTGSSGTDIPEDVTKNLSELRRLIFE